VRVFITGGAGFIGSHLCDALVARGDEVSILDNLSTGSKVNIAHLEGKIKVSQGDIRDKDLVEALVAESELVLHMAAALGVDNILENPIESISTNFYGSEVVLNASLKYDKRILIASTSEIYGKNTKQPLSEIDDRVIGTPQKLRWTYSDAKALEEATAHFLFLTKQLKITTIRFFNTVGPRQTGKYGMVIPRFVKAALENQPLKIFGDGSQTRVFCHVSDSVKAILALSLNDKTVGEVFNLGGKGEISILELAKLIVKQTNSKSDISFTDYEDAYSVGFEDMARRVPDISKLTKFIGWEPKLGLSTIIEDVSNSFS
jgi:UDP-glucose 4-epimerase